MQPLILKAQESGGIPKAFWDDVEIFGYLAGCIIGSIEIVSGGRNKDQSEIMVGVLDDLAGPGRGTELMEYLERLNNVRGFWQEMAKGLLTVGVARRGPSRWRNEPVVVRATDEVSRRGIPLESPEGFAAVSAAIQRQCFDRKVQRLRMEEDLF